MKKFILHISLQIRFLFNHSNSNYFLKSWNFFTTMTSFRYFFHPGMFFFHGFFQLHLCLGQLRFANHWEPSRTTMHGPLQSLPPAAVLRDEPQWTATSSLLPSSCPGTNSPFPTTSTWMHLPYTVHVKIRSASLLRAQAYRYDACFRNCSSSSQAGRQISNCKEQIWYTKNVEAEILCLQHFH